MRELRKYWKIYRSDKKSFYSLLHRSRTIKSYMETEVVKKLQIGSGPNVLDGWLNTDICMDSKEIVYLDASEPFPFEENTFDYIFSEHFIEHLPYREGLAMLNECYRILKPNGRIRIATPDLKTLIGLYRQEKSELQEKYIRWITDKFLPEVGFYCEVFVINNAFRSWGHQFLYDTETLSNALEKAGFVDISSCAPGESSDQHLKGLESHGRKVGWGNDEMIRFETIVLEATRHCYGYQTISLLH